jgi:hypothetical protein
MLTTPAIVEEVASLKVQCCGSHAGKAEQARLQYASDQSSANPSCSSFNGGTTLSKAEFTP